MTTDDLKKLEATLWQSADTLRANSDLKSSQSSRPALRLLCLRFADNPDGVHEGATAADCETLQGKRNERPIHEIAGENCGFYLAKEAGYEALLNLPEKEDIAMALKRA